MGDCYSYSYDRYYNSIQRALKSNNSDNMIEKCGKFEQIIRNTQEYTRASNSIDFLDGDNDPIDIIIKT